MPQIPNQTTAIAIACIYLPTGEQVFKIGSIDFAPKTARSKIATNHDGRMAVANIGTPFPVVGDIADHPANSTGQGIVNYCVRYGNRAGYKDIVNRHHGARPDQATDISKTMNVHIP
ncbi:MAG: hypothetical protein U1D70_12800 [Methylobacter sp.]|nr:hypothetical protein [Methylobacter sp.]MDP2429932.1 hypothetical protein [Methylobacter sp.]MDP3362861.1 hypothetical protein [Methylobacter sp.]MDZ4219885.1 hypothetical protein [Methylobacter sp.]